MRYQKVCLEGFGYSLPPETISSDEIERQLAPLYSRLRLPEGRLELMSGIRERRLWPRGTRPSDHSIASGLDAIRETGVDPARIGVLIHGSVCRDYLEPATAARVHHNLGLPKKCLVHDLSNACLGILSGVAQVATMIEIGQIDAGIVVGSEDSRSLLESTIAELNRNESLTRESVKPAFASLTIGSGSVAAVLVHEKLSRTGNKLLGFAARAHTEHYQLCEGGVESGNSILMQTDSERLLSAGLETGRETFDDFLAELSLTRDVISKSICHQVGGAHRTRMLQSLGLAAERDYATFPWMGNTGSVALPLAMALAVEENFVTRGDRVAWLGIGSGINCLMMAVDWQTTLSTRRKTA